MAARDINSWFRKRVPRLDIVVPWREAVVTYSELQAREVKSDSLPKCERCGIPVWRPAAILASSVDSPILSKWQWTIRMGTEDSACWPDADSAQSKCQGRLRIVLQRPAPPRRLWWGYCERDLGPRADTAWWVDYAASSYWLYDHWHLVQQRSYAILAQDWIHPCQELKAFMGTEYHLITPGISKNR